MVVERRGRGDAVSERSSAHWCNLPEEKDSWYEVLLAKGGVTVRRRRGRTVGQDFLGVSCCIRDGDRQKKNESGVVRPGKVVACQPSSLIILGKEAEAERSADVGAQVQ